MADDVASLQRQADELASLGDWGPKAETVNRRLVELDPNRIVAYTRLAKCLKEKGEIEVAEVLYRRVVELDPANTIATSNLRRLKQERGAAQGRDVDAAAAQRAAARRGPVRPVLDPELELLVEACSAVPQVSGDYQQPDYITNVLLTVLDLRMHNVAVDNSIRHYWNNRWDDIRTIDQLQDVLARHPDDRQGNRAVAQYLWGNNHWMRIEWLRGFVPFLVDNGLASQEALREWAHRSDFHRDFEGRVKNLGINAYKWLTPRLGVDTVKPDTHLHNFVEPVVGHPISDEELVRVVEAAARRIGLSPRQLDASLWEFQRGGPGTV